MMPDWVAAELGVQHVLEERPTSLLARRIDKHDRGRIEQCIARTGSIAAAMRETAKDYATVRAIWQEMREAAA